MSNTSVLVVLGVSDSGYRWILDVSGGGKEDKARWTGFLRHLKDRGLVGVRLFITNAYMGLAESLSEFYPEVRWQRSMAHFYRNISALFRPCGGGRSIET